MRCESCGAVVREEKSKTLPNHGGAPITFVVKRELALVSSAKTNNRRWHKIGIWYTTDKKIAVSVGYRSLRREESKVDAAMLFDHMGAALKWLESFDPIAFVKNFPDIDRFRDQREWVIKDLTTRWKDLIGQAALDAGVSMAEVYKAGDQQ